MSRSVTSNVEYEGRIIGSIRRRGTGFQFRCRINGIRKDFTLSKVATQELAFQQAREIWQRGGSAPIPSAAPTPVKSQTLADAFKQYKADYAKRRRKSSARRAFEIVEKFIGFVGETSSPAAIERAHVKSFQDKRAGAVSETTERALSPWTINNDLGRIRHFIRWMAREGLRPPAPDLTELKLPTETKSARGLSPKEVETVRRKLEACPDESLKSTLSDWFELAINVGFRPDEQAHLRACDYDETARKVHVRPWGDWKPKTAKGKRSLPVNEAAHAILSRRKLAAGRESDNLLFPTPVNTKWDLDNLRHRFQELLPEGFYFTLYSLRHTYAYREVAAGTPINALMLRMGHTDPKTTKGYFEGMDLDDIGAPPVLEPTRKAAQA